MSTARSRFEAKDFADFLDSKGYWAENGISKAKFLEEVAKYGKDSGPGPKYISFDCLIKCMYIAEEGGFGESPIGEKVLNLDLE